MKKIVLKMLCVLSLGVSAYADDVLTESGVAVSTAAAEVKFVSEPAGPEIEIQSPADESKENSEEILAGVLPGIIVKSNKITTLFKDETVGVSVITENQILSSRPKNLFDAIKFERGLTLQSYGDEAMMKSVSLRGGRSEELLVLKDGRPLNSISLGMTNLRTVNMDNVERVEIYRDAYSSVYGGSAFSGIVNLVSKTPEGEVPETTISGKFGGFGEQHYDLNFSLKKNSNEFTLGAGKKEVLGKLKNSALSSDNIDFLLRRISDKNAYKFSGGFFNDTTGDPRKELAKTSNKNYYLAAGYDRLAGNSLLSFDAYYNNDDQNYRDPDPSWPSDTVYLNQVLNTGISYKSGENMWAEIGQKYENYKNENRLTHRTDADKSILTQYAAALYRLELGKLVLTPSARIDHSEKYGMEFSPKITGVYRVSDPMNCSLTLSRGFRFPTFNETFYPSDGYAKGNELLKAEHSFTSEGGVYYEPVKDFLNLRLIGFMQIADDKIDTTWPLDPRSGYYSPQNLIQAVSSGMELETDLKFNKMLNLVIGYSYSESLEKNQYASSYRRSAYNPMNKLNAKLNGELFKNLSYFLGARYQTDSSINAYRIPDLFYSDLGLSYTTGDIEVFLNVENLTNKDYYFMVDWNGVPYKMPDRKIYGGLKVRFFD